MNLRTTLLYILVNNLFCFLVLTYPSLTLANQTNFLFDDLPTPMELKNNDTYLCKPYAAIVILPNGSILNQNVADFRIKFTQSQGESPFISMSEGFPFDLFKTDNQIYASTFNRYDGSITDFMKNEFRFGDADIQLFGALEKYESYVNFKFHNFPIGSILEANCFEF